MIVLQGVTKTYGARAAIDGVSLRIEPGECVCLLGPGGCGKSTLLSLIIGAISPTRGGVLVDGVDLRHVPAGALRMFRRRVGIVFQDGKLLQNRTVAENVAFSLEICGAADATIGARVPEVLKRMGLADRSDAFPRALSASEQTRTAIARAIAHKPLILLADEPARSLDASETKEVVALLRELHASGTTVIVATHDAVFAKALNARIIELRAGKVVRTDAATPPPPPAAKEPVIEEDLRAAAIAGVQERLESRSRQQRKVKVTAIHSD